MKKNNNQVKIAKSYLPMLVWLLAVACVVLLYVDRGSSFSVAGLALAPTQTVAAAEDGIVRNLAVQLYDPVKKGDTLAIVELGSPPENDYMRALMEAQQKTAQQELEKIKAELAAMESQLRYDMGVGHGEQAEQYRRLAVDVETARLDLLEARTLLEPDRVLLAGLELETKALKELLATQAVEPYEHEKARLESETQRMKVSMEEKLVLQAEENLRLAQARLDSHVVVEQEKDLVKRLLAPYEKAVTVQEKLLDELFAPTGRMTLMAPFDGVVSSILCTEGQGVTAGQVLLTVCQSSADQVVVWMDQSRAGLMLPGMPVDVIKQTEPRQIFRSCIASISPAVELMPQQLWASPGLPRWGRPAKIKVSAEVGLSGNEIVGIRGL